MLSDTLAIAAAIVATSGTVTVVAALRFARWAVNREDEEEAAERPRLTPAEIHERRGILMKHGAAWKARYLRSHGKMSAIARRELEAIAEEFAALDREERGA